MNERLQLMLASAAWLLVFHYVLKMEWRLVGLVACVWTPVVLFTDWTRDEDKRR